MVSDSTFIKNKTGLHARPASEFVQAANKFSSKITIFRTSDETDTANAKSIMDILMLGLLQGEKVAIQAEGEDEKEAVAGLIALINTGFGE